jgi:hypothetical protein
MLRLVRFALFSAVGMAIGAAVGLLPYAILSWLGYDAIRRGYALGIFVLACGIFSLWKNWHRISARPHQR